MASSNFSKDLGTLAAQLSSALAEADTEAKNSAIPVKGDAHNAEYFLAVLESAADEIMEIVCDFERGRRDSDELLETAAQALEQLTDAGQDIEWLSPAWHDRYQSFLKALKNVPAHIPRGRLGRRDFYVYTHRDNAGRIFYVGKGTGNRAWSKDRDILWHRYVETRSDGRYTVKIVRERLLEHEALSLESELMFEHGKHLVNWDRPLPSIELTYSDGRFTVTKPGDSGRKTDSKALERYNQMRDDNLRLVTATKGIEGSKPEQAVSDYRKALKMMREYESIEFETGLVADLLSELGKPGDPVILDRLTLCLKKLGRRTELIAEAERYFNDFPTAKQTSIGQRILKRVEKASRDSP